MLLTCTFLGKKCSKPLFDLPSIFIQQTLFSGKLDLERVGMYGYSLGGATAAKVLSVDSRFQAGINLDGRLLGEVTNASLSQPFMLMLRKD